MIAETATREETTESEAPVRETASDAALISAARPLVKDLFAPSAFIYWTDLLFTIGVAVPAFYFAHGLLLGHSPFIHSPFPILDLSIGIVLFLIAALGFYRAVLFTHELVHLREDFTGFRAAWNLLCGIPLLVPSFLYHTHLDHHRPAHYATDKDGEYLPLARGPFIGLVSFLGVNVFVPALTAVRFGVLTPLAWVCGPLRRLVHKYASAMVIDPAYARPTPSPRQLRIWRLQEAVCLAYVWFLVWLFVSGTVHWSWLVQAYGLAVFVLTINGLRTLAAHRYRHDTDEPLTLTEQLLDSINHPNRPWLTAIWAPVGLRFHALHHLFPGLPYHALPEAHRRLMASLPEGSPYRRVNSPSLRASLGELLRDIRAARQSTESGLISGVGHERTGLLELSGTTRPRRLAGDKGATCSFAAAEPEQCEKT